MYLNQSHVNIMLWPQPSLFPQVRVESVTCQITETSLCIWKVGKSQGICFISPGFSGEFHPIKNTIWITEFWSDFYTLVLSKFRIGDRNVISSKSSSGSTASCSTQPSVWLKQSWPLDPKQPKQATPGSSAETLPAEQGKTSCLLLRAG